MTAKQLSDKLLTKLRELSEKPDGWGDIRMIEPADARAILAALPSDAAQAPQAVPDMVWLKEDSEQFAHSIDEAVDDYVNANWPVPSQGGEIEFEAAFRLPDVKVRVWCTERVNDDDPGYGWEIIDAAPVAPAAPNPWQDLYASAMTTLAPAFDYIQTHADQFGATAGDCKMAIIAESFPKLAAAAMPDETSLEFQAACAMAYKASQAGIGPCGVFIAGYRALRGDYVDLGEPIANAQPVEMSPEFTDSARAALVWVLYHHQGGSSPVGQPIRFALGMGVDEPLKATQIGEALKLAKESHWAWARDLPSAAHDAPAAAASATRQGNRTPIDGDRNARGN